ncbi:MAG: amidohydrolase family protein [Bacteroidia bacterium]|nr:amidohydrolase family protein [Bacteroidia bacterium]
MITYNTPLLISNEGPPLHRASVVCDDEGRVISVAEGYCAGAVDLDGVLVPGFVNAHCHLELSHLKGKIPEREGGMTGFIRALLAQRFLSDEAMQVEAMHLADHDMWAEGIVAVGDISNSSLSAEVKRDSRIRYHTFVELLGLEPAKAAAIVKQGMELLQYFTASGRHTASLTPHAPYSVSQRLYAGIFNSMAAGDPLSIHMQESEDELAFCRDVSGPMADFFREASFPLSDFVPFGSGRPLEHLLPSFPKQHRLQLVHNTYTNEGEMHAAESVHPQLYWCLCPGANGYITGRLPDVMAMYRLGLRVTIGTDSLASNRQLSVLEELKLISKNFPGIPFTELLKWAGLNGAEFLGMENEFGKIKSGWKPGLILLEGMNPENPVLHEGVSCRRIC